MAAAELSEEIDRLVQAVEHMTASQRETTATAAALAGVAVLEEIRDAVQQIVANAVTGEGSAVPSKRTEELGPDEQKAKSSTFTYRPFQQVENWAKGSRLGRIGQRMADRARPHLRYLAHRRDPLGTTKKKGANSISTLLGRIIGGGKGLGGAAGAGAGAEAGAAGGAARGAAGGPWGMAIGAVLGTLLADGGKQKEDDDAGGDSQVSKYFAPFAATVGTVVSLTIAMKEMGDQVVDFGYEMETVNRRLSEFSAEQSLAWSELDANRIHRSMQTGDNTAGSARDLATAIDRFEAATRPFDELSTNLQNIVGGKLMGMVASIVEMISPVADAANRWLGTSDSGVGEGQGADWMRLMAQDEERKRQATASRMDAVRAHHNRK